MVTEHSQTIVVADDDERMRELVVRILNAAGYEVVAAEDGRQAVALNGLCVGLFVGLVAGHLQAKPQTGEGR
jgi:FixJ family two-component response regulator